MKKILFPILLLIVMVFSNSNASTHGSNTKALDKTPVKNVIFLVGDGMGLAQVSKAMQQRKKPLNLERATHIGLSKTSSASEVITDSAASATAFSIGVKANNGTIGLDAKGQSKQTLLELLASRGYATGLIATSSITHATPASFYAHVNNRENHYLIAEKLADAPVSLFIGGATDYFNKRTDKKRGQPDNRDLLQEMASKGVTLIDSLDDLKQASGRVGYFTADEHPPSIIDGRSDYLPESIQPSIDFLRRQSGDGFFMLVEGSQIDWGGHVNDLEYTLSELYDFDNAVGAAMAFAEKEGNTLVLITADHETGGLTLPPSDLNSDAPYNDAGHAFSTIGHTSTMVPVYAFGKGAKEFSGVYENTEIYHKILRVLNQ